MRSPDVAKRAGAASLVGLLAAERPRLVSLCARLSGSANDAEDLAQETLLEAWRNAHKLHDPSGLSAWLNAIARNVCKRHARRQGREAARLEQLDDNASNVPDGQVDESLMVEREDLARLLDRAMGLLPPETRSVLVQRYIDESPQAQVALRLGLSEGAVAMRLRRGTFALRRLLATELRAEAVEFGLTAADDRWTSTRVWCFLCATHRLEGRLVRRTGEFSVRCSGCNAGRNRHLSQATMPLLHRGTGSAGDGIWRLMDWLHQRYWASAATGKVRCVTCEQPVPAVVRPLTPPQDQFAPWARYEVDSRCATCRKPQPIGLMTFALTMPEGRRFWRAHPRMRVLRERDVEFGGQPAVVLGLESVVDSGRLEIVATRDRFAVAGLHRTG